jgi:lipid-A-disaccharide synthase
VSSNGNGNRRSAYLVAGDISGDQNCGRLAQAIRRMAPDVQLVGAGGPAMREAGVEVQVETTDLSFVGLPGPRMIHEHFSTYLRVLTRIRASHPDLVVLVDNEWTNLVLATLLRRKGVPVMFFFPPQVWLWGRWRLPTIVPLARRVLSAFRDEAALYRSAGADTVWVGHPLCDVVHVNDDPAAALREIGLDPARPLVALMPGSRRNEIRNLAGPILGAARLLQERDPTLQFALPLAGESLRADVECAVRASRLRDVAIYRPRSYAVLSQAKVVLQCSGTATLEAALLGIPAVIAYRCKRLEYFFARYLILDVDFIGMPNILFGEMVQPEFFNKNVDAEHLADEAWSLLRDQSRRRMIQSRLMRIREVLGPPGAFRRAAEAVVELLPEPAEQQQRLAVGS